MDTWRQDEVAVSAKVAKTWSDWDDYVQGLDDGWKQYKSIWEEWEGPGDRR